MPLCSPAWGTLGVRLLTVYYSVMAVPPEIPNRADAWWRFAPLMGLLLVTLAYAQEPPPTVIQKLQDAFTIGEALQKKGDFAGALERFRFCASLARENGIEKE